MKKLTQIDKFVEGTKVQGFYICVKKFIRTTKGGDLFIDLELQDMSGTIHGKIWDNASELSLKFDKGDAVAVSGIVELYREILQLKINKINKATRQYYGRYGFDPTKIVLSSKKDPYKMWKSILNIIGEIKIKELRRVIFIIYKENKSKIIIKPSSVNSSYNFRSGFLEQTLLMAQIAKKITPFYKLDKDLVIGGALLIKIGVIKQIKSGYISDNSREGHLLGQTILGRDILNTAIKRLKNFPEDLKLKLEHIIISHENNYQPNTSYRPSFPEALLIHSIYKMNSNMKLMEQIIHDDSNENEFTNTHNHFRLSILKE